MTTNHGPEGGDAAVAITRYIEHCRVIGLAPRHIAQKQSHLAKFADEFGPNLCELTSRTLAESMRRLIDQGRSARTANFRRSIVRAWGAWLEREGVLDANPFHRTAAIDERNDQRYMRRALTDDEVSRLLAVAAAQGPRRLAWYAFGLYAGLRRGEIVRLLWRHVRIEEAELIIEGGKSGRRETVPIAPPLANAIAAIGRGEPDHRVFPRPLSNDRRVADYLAAGIPSPDPYGRICDLHSLRRTLHMRLVRAAVAPQIAQRIMRHSDYRVTLAHYTDELSRESSQAIARVFHADHVGASPANIDGWIDTCPCPLNNEQRTLVRMVTDPIARNANGTHENQQTT